jgi:predicted alpha/beta hydrolase family esterase
MLTTLIVPGLNGSQEGHWQDWWLRDNSNARRVEQADWANPVAEVWRAELEAAIRRNPYCIIVAHSLGAILTASLANSPVAGLVAGALLVAPADIERTGTLHRRTYDFGKMPKASLPFPSMVVASHDDIYLSFKMATDLATAWGSSVHDMGYVGHINIPSGFGRWHEAYGLAQSLRPPESARATR